MTQYTHRLTLAVPEQLIPQANQLALIMGESAADVNTFTQASYEDTDGNKYAVCSFVSKPVVLGALSAGLPETLPTHAEEADRDLALQALGLLTVFEEGYNIVSPDYLLMAVDVPPQEALTKMGVTAIVVPEEV